MEKRNTLVLGRRESETVIIFPEKGLPIEIRLGRVAGGRARLSILATPNVRIIRGELWEGTDLE